MTNYQALNGEGMPQVSSKWGSRRRVPELDAGFEVMAGLSAARLAKVNETLHWMVEHPRAKGVRAYILELDEILERKQKRNVQAQTLAGQLQFFERSVTALSSHYLPGVAAVAGGVLEGFRKRELILDEVKPPEEQIIAQIEGAPAVDIADFLYRMGSAKKTDKDKVVRISRVSLLRIIEGEPSRTKGIEYDEKDGAFLLSLQRTPLIKAKVQPGSELVALSFLAGS